MVSTSHLDAAEAGNLPDPAEQLDRLVLYFGQHQTSPGECLKLAQQELRAKIGAVTVSDEQYVFAAAIDEGLIEKGGSGSDFCGRLTMKGWEAFHELQRGAVHSRTAFMAMPFGIPKLIQVVDSAFRPAVEETGFRLQRVDDQPEAGLIDNRMRVGIRLSRFLIADLTGANNGAYWEAGYAEGLGKPVIYTCSKSYFDEHKTHFDTNHCQTVFWDPENPDKAAEDLKDTIRATLPFEAKMPEE